MRQTTRRLLALLALMLLLFTGCAPKAGKAEANRYTASFLDLFDTFSQMILYCDTKEEANALAQDIHDELLNYHQLYDIYNAYENINNLYTVNQQAATAPVQVEQRLMDLLVFAKEMYKLTDGRVNVAMGSVLSIWHDYRTSGMDDPQSAVLPPMEQLTEAAKHTNIDDLVLDTENLTVAFRDPALKLDVGAVGKGYAVERVAQLLIERGVTNALLSIGGNVRTIGTHADGTDFRVAVENPDKHAENQTLLTLNLHDLSLVTSGSYQRYYTVAGKAYHHIIDPDTLMPSAYFWAVSVITQDSGLADALSTALYNLPIEKGKTLIDGLDGVEVLWVANDGTLIESDGFSALVAK
ncbi:MAG: FAD:protein FMN transferase [Clostridia bacterium]